MWQKPEPSSYSDLSTMIRKKMQQDGQVNQKIMAAFSTAYEEAFKESKVVLSRPEERRLFSYLLEEILSGLVAENKKPQS